MKEDNITVTELLDGEGTKEPLISKEEKLSEIGKQYIPIITNRSLVLNDLVEHTFGKYWITLWTIAFYIAFEIVIAAQAAMFASAMTSTVPLWWGDTCNVYDYEGIVNECRWKYLVWLGLFCALNVTLTLIGLEDQKVL